MGAGLWWMRWLVPACLVACSFQHGTLQQTPKDSALVDNATIDSAIDAFVSSPDAKSDATMMPGCNSTSCGNAGGTCSNNSCGITAQDGQSVTCPASTDCDISCPNDNQSCQVGMTCATNSVCTIHCTADHSCNGNSSTLVCATGSTCEIFCKSGHTCDSLTMTCGTGATCKYHCCGSACNGFTCTGTGCMDAGATCP